MIAQCCQDKINQILIQTVSLELGDFTDEGIRLVNDGNLVFEGEHHVGAKFQLHVLAVVVAWILLTLRAANLFEWLNYCLRAE